MDQNGYRNDQYEIVLGSGQQVFLRAVNGLQTWQAHRLPGVEFIPKGTPIALGTTVIVTMGVPILALAAPCRIVGIVDEPTAWGFAYGTLPPHPEQGEEAFMVSIAAE
jgi:uncharacterized protein (UPF0548 family)